MEKKEFRAESKKLMNLMINSIYTNKEIFLRELLSNASDALDKAYYLSLEDSSIKFNKDDYYIEVKPDKENRTLTISDTGIGMNSEEMEENLGTIAKSGTLDFKKLLKEKEQPSEIIGQFGVGFYSAFMVAKKVKVHSRKLGEESGYIWESEGPDGYRIYEEDKKEHGTDIILYLKDDSDDEDYSKYLDEFHLEELIQRYSNYLRYPIYLLGEEEKKQVNSMVPIWKKNKNELTDEDYKNFYFDQHYGFDEPLDHIHISAEGLISYRGILFIPSSPPMDYYSKEYKKGLQLYSNGVLIMDKYEDLLPDFFGFVKGVIDSEDLSLNISRETLQQDRQLRAMAKNLESKIASHLKKMEERDREKYKKFYKAFGSSLKLGIYESFGQKKDVLQDLLLFHSSAGDEPVTLQEYEDRMKEDQDAIYYATGNTVEQIKKLPQGGFVKEKGYEYLYLTEAIDEFVLKAMKNYHDLPFKNISDELSEGEEKNVEEEDLFKKMKDFLPPEVVEVRGTSHLEDDPVCLRSRGEISIEMERTFLTQPGTQNITAQKVLEINKNHPIYQALKEIDDEELLKKYTDLLYEQARLIEGLPIKDPVEHTKNIMNLVLK